MDLTAPRVVAGYLDMNAHVKPNGAERRSHTGKPQKPWKVEPIEKSIIG